MNIAVGIGALLLGGWVLNPSGSDDQTKAPPRSSAETALPPGISGRGDVNKGTQGDTGQRGERRERSRLEGVHTPGYDTQPSGSSGAKGFLPTPPTEPGRAWNGKYVMPTPPTGVGRDAEYRNPWAAVNPSGDPSAPTFPQIPTSRQSYQPHNVYSPSYYEQRSYERKESSPYSNFGSGAVPDKPFAKAQPFASGVSPYMGLFRNDTAGGTIDNYTTFVRPALDQRSMNQQFNVDIYGLERNARLQQAAMRQREREDNSRTPQSISTPQFYMNYGGYYPSAGSGRGQ
jgi:hypothetical protein